MTDVESRALRIDAHTHVFAPRQRDQRSAIVVRDPMFAEMYSDPGAKIATADDLLGVIDRAGLDGAVAAGFAFSAPADIDTQNEHLLETAARSGGKVAALATVNPAIAGWEREAEAALKAGARGFGEIRPAGQGWDPLGPPGRALCELAAHHGAVLLWHASEPVGHPYPGKTGGISASELLTLALEYPHVAMVGAHLGAGAPFFFLMPELKAAIEALYFDTAAASLLYHGDAVARVVDLVGPSRVLFGSDFPLLSPARQLATIGGALTDGPVRQAVLGGNAGSLYFSSRLAKSTGVNNSGA